MKTLMEKSLNLARKVYKDFEVTMETLSPNNGEPDVLRLTMEKPLTDRGRMEVLINGCTVTFIGGGACGDMIVRFQTPVSWRALANYYLHPEDFAEKIVCATFPLHHYDEKTAGAALEERVKCLVDNFRDNHHDTGKAIWDTFEMEVRKAESELFGSFDPIRGLCADEDAMEYYLGFDPNGGDFLLKAGKVLHPHICRWLAALRIAAERMGDA